MKRIILLCITSLMIFSLAIGQTGNQVLNLEFRSGNSVSNYKGVKIGEYYWMDNNFYDPVFNIASQAVINKHMDGWGVPYNIPEADFNRYYGQYYPPSSLPNGQMFENGTLAGGWQLPNVADVFQLLAMCGTGSYKDIKEYLGAKTNDNPVAVNLTESGDISNGHWFKPNKNVYGFSLLPGGGRMNGPWGNLNTGDFYALYKRAQLRVVENKGLVIFDNLNQRVYFESPLYHWLNVRWAKKIPDEELGYKLYIKDSDFKKYENSNIIENFDISTVNIIRLNLQDQAPAGYIELPNGWIRGFYIQKYGTESLASHLRIITEDNNYTFKEKNKIKIYLRTYSGNNENINFGLYNPLDNVFRKPINVISRDGFVYTCELPDNYIGDFMIIPYLDINGSQVILKRDAYSPWIDRLPLTIKYNLTKKYVPSDAFEVTDIMQLNIKENGKNVVNKVFQVDVEKSFMVSMPTSDPNSVKIGLFYSNGDFYTDITTGRKGSVYICKVPSSTQGGEYIIMPFTKENGIVKVVERKIGDYYMDRLPLVVLEEDIWGDDLWASKSAKETLTPYVNNNTLYIKGLISPSEASIINVNGSTIKVQKNVTQETGISISELKSGIYFVQLIQANGKIENVKFIKK